MSEQVAPAAETMPMLANPFKGMKRKRKRKSMVKGDGDIAGLNLTAMMDMMTILLVFLIQSFAVEPSAVPPDLKPPTSTASMEVRPSITIYISQENLIVDGKQVARLADLDVSKQKTIGPLVDVLTNAKSKQDALKTRRNIEDDETALLLVAHEDTPYDMLMAVLVTAGNQGFNKYRLQVIHKEKK